jgi:hypothetical protein
MKNDGSFFAEKQYESVENLRFCALRPRTGK